jgi:NADH dehydrogenase/NADH:ubiquinone oxidoreductase subunit G
MINGKGRLQRLNRAVRGPGQARDDWEILRDLLQAIRAATAFTRSRMSFAMSERIPELRADVEPDQRSRRAGYGPIDRPIPGEPAREKCARREKEKHPQ